MTRNDWIKQNFTHVTFTESVGTLRVPRINVELTYGLLSTENYDEFQKLVFHLMPSGTIVDDIDPEFYEGKVLLLRNMLTRMLMEEANAKMAQRYLDILERRDRSHWSKDSGKQLKVEQKEDKTLNITFGLMD